MLKKITVEDRREMLVAELRKMEGDPAGMVPNTLHEMQTVPLCTLGIIHRLWPEHIDWSHSVNQRYADAAALVGARLGDVGAIVMGHDCSDSYPEVADKLEKLFAGLPVAG